MSTAPVRSGTAADLGAVRDRLWQAVRTGDEYAATDVVLDAVRGGIGMESALLELIAPVQARVGTEWAAGRLTVAQEHAVTAVHERVIAALAHHPEGRGEPPWRPRITVACVDGEWHALPARLLAEVLRLRGWHVDFLGAHVPTAHLIAHLHRTGPYAVALSSSLATRLPTAHAAVTAVQAVGVPVLVGGAAFGPGGRYARALGADDWAPGAREAAALLDAGVARPDPLAAHQPVDDLPHLADQEYTMVVRTRTVLVKETLADLEDTYPPMRAYSERQREHTAEDLGHVVDHLGAALYVDDTGLFTGFIEWTAHVLAARGVPARALCPALESLRVRLGDFPRARRILGAAHDALTSRPAAPNIPGSGKSR
ncbi:B12-binding domain-containing protein [Streptomyces sp. NPDC052040]|uniref:B12-binding domain-containing protein n=1 Tax=Streptomyces sp. NPDC052040 TaxID=3365682 RepID=UPI0037D31982